MGEKKPLRLAMFFVAILRNEKSFPQCGRFETRKNVLADNGGRNETEERPLFDFTLCNLGDDFCGMGRRIEHRKLPANGIESGRHVPEDTGNYGK